MSLVMREHSLQKEGLALDVACLLPFLEQPRLAVKSSVLYALVLYMTNH